MAKSTLTAERFIIEWFAEAERNGSCEELGDRFGLKKESVYQRGNTLNTKFLEKNLPELPPLRINKEKKARGHKVDVDKLAAIAQAQRATKAAQNVD